MRILFVQDNGINESLALCDLAGLLREKGHFCELLIEKNEKNLFKKIEEINPQLFIIPWDVGADIWVERMIKKIREQFSNPLIICGTYPSFNPGIIENPDIDIMCVGETEYAILELIENLENKKEIKNIQNLYVKQDGKIFKNSVRPLIDNLDELPLPDRDIYYKRYKFLRNISMKRFTAGRGCPNSCYFCFNRNFKKIYEDKGTFVRLKSVKRILEEISRMKERYPLHSIHFSDDLFTNNKEWIINFSKKYKENFKIPFTFNTTVDAVDEEMLASLKEANCSGIAIGVETADEKVRKEKLNKPYNNEQIIKTAKLIKKYKIQLTTFNMIALPGETIEQAFETVGFNRKISADNPRVNLAFAIPNTLFTEDAIKKGYLEKNFETKIHMAFTKPVFKSNYNREFENLYYLFELAVKNSVFEKLVKKLINFPITFLFKFFLIFRFLREKKFFKIKFLSGVIFYLNTGNPLKRTKNFNNFIP